MAPAPQHGRVHAGLASAAVPDAPAVVAVTPAAAVTGEHKFMTVPPVRALMLSTAWKNDAENLRALGYTPKDNTFTIVQKSSAADLLSKMQAWANQLTILSKMPPGSPGLADDHPLKAQLAGLEVLCAVSSKAGNALAFYKPAQACWSIDGCLGNLALGNNEQAEAALVAHLVSLARKDGATSMCVRARVAPSGTVYLPSYYTDLGFAPVPAAAAFSDGPGAALAALAREKANELPIEKVGWGGMWVEANGDDALLFVLEL